jgi:cbb3-type cytochrome oxidase cytochrome c subunit
MTLDGWLVGHIEAFHCKSGQPSYPYLEGEKMSENWSFFEKNMEMWEKWTSTYMDTMSKAMEKTMEQSSAFKKQVDKAVATAVSAQFDATLAAIQSLEKQVEALSSKIDELLEQED